MRSNIDKRISRLDFQRMDYLNEQANKLEQDEKEKQDKYNAQIFEEAYSGNGSFIHNKRVKEQANLRTFTYNEHFMTMALTELLSECAEKALLLNTEEYAKINPEYKNEIKNTIANFLENADINEKINNEFILEAYNIIKENTPSADLYLSESDEKFIVQQHLLSNKSIENGLDNLCRDVRVRVANIVTKDQEAMNKSVNDIEYAKEKELTAAPVVPVEQPEAEVAPLADPDQPVEEPVTTPVEPQVVTESTTPRLKIIKEQEKHGIVETLTMNEATKMLSEGKEYDKTLALANAIKFITVLEAVDASGLVTIGDAGYNKILTASGVVSKPVVKVEGLENKPQQTPELKMTKTEAKVKSELSDILKNAIPEELSFTSKTSMFKPFAEWKANNKSSVNVVDTPMTAGLTENLHGKYTNMKGEVFTEEALREYFEKQGFDLNYVDFDDLRISWHFTKH